MKPPGIRTSVILWRHKQQSMRALHRRTTWEDGPRLLRSGNLLFADANIQDASGAATTLRSRRHACDPCSVLRDATERLLLLRPHRRRLEGQSHCISIFAALITALHRSTSSRMYLDVFSTEPPKISADNFLR